MRIDNKHRAVQLQKDLMQTVILALPQLIDELENLNENLARLCKTIDRRNEAIPSVEVAGGDAGS